MSILGSRQTGLPDHPEVIARQLLNRAWPVALVLLCALVPGCGGDASAPSRSLTIAVVTGDGQAVEVGTAFAQPVAFKVTDASGKGVAGISVSFSVASGAATVSPPTTTTDGQGLAATTVTAGQVAGQIVIAARATGATQAANATLTSRPGIVNLVGQWSGTTGQNLPVRMRINAGGSIDSVTVRLTATFGLSTCTGTVVRTDVRINADSTFETTVGIGFPTTMRGRFTTANTVSGTIDGYSGSFGVVCGPMVMIGTGSPWSAMQWQGQRQ